VSSGDGGFSVMHLVLPFASFRFLADPRRPSRVYAYEPGGEALRSDTRGSSWTEIDGGRQLALARTGLLWRLTDDDAVYVSIDGGDTWTPMHGAPAGITTLTTTGDARAMVFTDAQEVWLGDEYDTWTLAGTTPVVVADAAPTGCIGGAVVAGDPATRDGVFVTDNFGAEP
jgi:hypothetical protein